MAGFVMRKNQRLKKLVPVRYLRDGMAGEGIIKDLSLSGSYITGNAPVSVGLALALQMFVPGDPEPLLIDRATVKWIKGSEFGVDFDIPQPKMAERITTVISTLVKTQQGSFRKGKSRLVYGPTFRPSFTPATPPAPPRVRAASPLSEAAAEAWVRGA